MMDIRKLNKILTIADFSVFVLATIFVIVFQFSGLPIFVTLSLVIYTIGFLLICAIAVLELVDNRVSRVEILKTTDSEKKSVALEQNKKAFIWKIAKICLSALFAIFTFVVLILY